MDFPGRPREAMIISSPQNLPFLGGVPRALNFDPWQEKNFQVLLQAYPCPWTGARAVAGGKMSLGCAPRHLTKETLDHWNQIASSAAKTTDFQNIGQAT